MVKLSIIYLIHIRTLLCHMGVIYILQHMTLLWKKIVHFHSHNMHFQIGDLYCFIPVTYMQIGRASCKLREATRNLPRGSHHTGPPRLRQGAPQLHQATPAARGTAIAAPLAPAAPSVVRRSPSAARPVPHGVDAEVVHVALWTRRG